MPASPTPERTRSPLGADAPEVTQVLALSGFPEFARQFAAAVDANDTHFFIDRAYFQTFHCVVPGETPATESACQGMGAPPTEPAIPVGLWNSEGDVFTVAAYGELIQDRLSEEHAPDAYTFGLGHEIRGVDEQSSGVDLIVADVAQPDVPSGQTPLRPPALVFRADVINKQWQLVSADRASTPDVPYFFDWYSIWNDVFPPG